MKRRGQGQGSLDWGGVDPDTTPADQPKECDTCLDVNFLHNHVCDHPADHLMPAQL